jgi:hypothetical protein
MGAERIGHELRREAAPCEGGAGRQCGRDAPDTVTAAQRVGRQGQGGQRRQGAGQRPPADVVRGRGRGDGGQEGHAADDGRDGEDVPRPDALVQRPRPEHEQQREAEGEGGLHDGERREQQRGGLQRPPEQAERRAGEPARAAQQASHERRPQAVGGRHHPRFERLQRDAEVVHRGGRTRGQSADDDGGHDATPR